MTTREKAVYLKEHRNCRDFDCGDGDPETDCPLRGYWHVLNDGHMSATMETALDAYLKAVGYVGPENDQT